jgi:hypothetical protein
MPYHPLTGPSPSEAVATVVTMTRASLSARGVMADMPDNRPAIFETDV